MKLKVCVFSSITLIIPTCKLSYTRYKENSAVENVAPLHSTLIAFEDVGWGVEVLIESLLAVK